MSDRYAHGWCDYRGMYGNEPVSKLELIEMEAKRTRMSKQLAQALLEDKGDFAYMYCLEKLDENPENQLWRDTLKWLNDLTERKETK
jgi:hypothetical protein